MPSEYYWRARKANTSPQNTISGREDHQSGTQCHQNTIGGRAKPTPVLRILLAGGRTTKVEHSAIRILLAGGRTTQVEHNAVRILLAGGRTTTVERNVIRILLAGGRTTNMERSAIRILLAGGRAMGHPVWDLQSYQLAGEGGRRRKGKGVYLLPDSVVHPYLPKRGAPVHSQ